jgi:hypothetical protein
MIILVVPYFLVGLALLVAGFWWPMSAFAAQAAIVAMLELLFAFEYRSRRPRMASLGPLYTADHGFFEGTWCLEEYETIKKYHLALRVPAGAKLGSFLINSNRWFSILLWLPLMLWNQLWIPSLLIFVHFFLVTPLAVRLDPLSHLVSSKFEAHRLELGMFTHLVTQLHRPERWAKKLDLPSEVKEALRVLDELGPRFDSKAFGLVRTHVERGFLQFPRDFVAMVSEGMPVRQIVLQAVANTSGDLVQSGEHHIYRGVLDPMGPGEHLLRIYENASDELVSMGAADQAYAERHKKGLRQNIAEVG